MRRLYWTRRQFSSKSDSCPESIDVDTAGISRKVNVHYPGRSVRPPRAIVAKRRQERRTEVSREHSRSHKFERTEGSNILIVVGQIEVYLYGEAENRYTTLCRVRR